MSAYYMGKELWYFKINVVFKVYTFKKNLIFHENVTE